MNKILDAREQRSIHIQSLMKDYPEDTIVVLKLNVVGTNKNPKHMKFICMLFDNYIHQEFQQKIINTAKTSSFDGDYIYYIIKEEANTVKERTIYIEDNHYFGRLVDLDVYNKRPISRDDIECQMRKCLICDNYAHICVRNRTHSIEEINMKVFHEIESHLPKFILNEVMSQIYEELELYPKFGLVSKIDNGSHNDMNFEMFLRSSFALKPFIEKFIKEGLKKFDPKKLQKIGMAAEEKMFSVTKGINTQKGLIFALGIFLPCFVRTILMNEDETYLLNLIKDTAHEIIGSYFDDLESKENLSHGDKIYLDTGLKGIRGEALKGFDIVFEKVNVDGIMEYDLPYEYLLYIMSRLDDTTIIHRKGLSTLREVQETMKGFIKNGGYNQNIAEVRNLSDEYKKRGISPGGSSDMLVLKLIYEHLKFLMK